MKKLILPIATAILMLVLCACSSDPGNTVQPDSTKPQPSETAPSVADTTPTETTPTETAPTEPTPTEPTPTEPVSITVTQSITLRCEDDGYGAEILTLNPDGTCLLVYEYDADWDTPGTYTLDGTSISFDFGEGMDGSGVVFTNSDGVIISAKTVLIGFPLDFDKIPD